MLQLRQPEKASNSNYLDNVTAETVHTFLNNHIKCNTLYREEELQRICSLHFSPAVVLRYHCNSCIALRSLVHSAHNETLHVGNGADIELVFAAFDESSQA